MNCLQYNKAHPITKGRTLIVNKGKTKDSLLTFMYSIGPIMHFEGDIKHHYSQVDMLDEFGKPILSTHTDMTGRPVVIGNIISYSAKSGAQSNQLEIGKVAKISNIGNFTVKRLCVGGDAFKGKYHQERVIPPDRCLLLPVDEETVVMWVLQGFEDLV